MGDVCLKPGWKDEALALLMDLLAIRSVNGEDDETEMAEYIRRYLEDHGVGATVRPLGGKKASVVAALGADGPTMVWNGHLDTVAYGDLDRWETDPAVPIQKGGRIYGRGSADMKSGLAAFVYALCAMSGAGAPLKHKIIFIGSGDEESGAAGAMDAVEAGLMEDARFVLIGEPTGMAIGLAQKGGIWLEMEVKGKTGHGAYPKEGINAIEDAFRLAVGIKTYVESFSHELLGPATAQITMVEGGIMPNMTPDVCKIMMDIRLVPAITKEMVLTRLNDLANVQEEPGTLRRIDYSYSRHLDRLSLGHSVEKDKDNPFVRELADSFRACGLEPQYVGLSYITDGSVLINHDPTMTIALFGPGEAQMAHKPNESVRADDYLKAIEILVGAATVGEGAV
ncbi:MAG: M20 family metallopeptidase [Lachnospiraceae bacterium]|jgi:succinyl-diaminopimelate desuccinylase|nr:M20 family metallopeptidase [Lachnospiraceae bacterium]